MGTKFGQGNRGMTKIRNVDFLAIQAEQKYFLQNRKKTCANS
jgi:hypothetical protein